MQCHRPLEFSQGSRSYLTFSTSLSVFSHKKKLNLLFSIMSDDNQYALESDSAIQFFLKMPSKKILTLCLQVSNRSATSNGAMAPSFIFFSIVVVNFLFFFYLIIIKKCCIVKSSAIFIYHDNQIFSHCSSIFHFFF